MRLARLLPLCCLLALGPAPGARAAFPFVDPERGVTTLAPLLRGTTPAVVNISVETRVAVENPLLNDPFFRRFFDSPNRPVEREALAAGSGVIVNAREGLVITNHHVVAKAQRITVTLKDGRQLRATRVGSDAGTDVALLRIPAERLTQLSFGDSDKLEVGDLVLAIGNPFGLGQTVTSGIVSALGRSGISDDNYEDFIQTDASINPGNSGGALIDSAGRLVGINTAIIAPGGGNVGIGFAVPANMVRTVMTQLLEHGSVRRGRIGVVIQDLSPDASDGGPREGAVVARVEAGSPAAKAGLRPGDVITAVDGAPVRNSAALRNHIGLLDLDRTVALRFVRDGQPRTASLQIVAAGSAERATP